jgi:hypothetical protein
MNHIVINGQRFVLNSFKDIQTAWREMIRAGIDKVFVLDHRNEPVPDRECGGFHTLSPPNPMLDFDF